MDPEKPVDDIVEKTPYMECELRTGEKLMVPLHRQCETLEYQELPASAERPSDVKNAEQQPRCRWANQGRCG